MVIIAGYENELQNCFFNYNEGLQSRFTWRYHIEKYNGNDLYNIFKNMVSHCKWEIDENVNESWFLEKLEHFKYYGRDIEVLLSKTKIAHSKRMFGKKKIDADIKKLNIDDLEKGFVKFLTNNNSENIKQEEYIKRQLYNTLYC
jgi:SpoVK/Ycf46/Vps4 family AAA+-type ATPase